MPLNGDDENHKSAIEQRPVDRRSFLHSAGALGLALAGGRLSSVLSTGRPPAIIAHSLRTPFRTLEELDLVEATVDQLQRGMSSGHFSARMLTEAYLARIIEFDDTGPRLRSVLETNPDAIKIAEQLDAERRARGPRGPLHGIPVVMKDVVDTADHMHTTAGSLALVESTPLRDAFIAARLREAGAILLGKTNLSEWSNFRSTHATAGWSARGGLTRNPYALDRSPCGSSSGSGVAIAANLAAIGIGAETDGSILTPCSANGLVGIKPTVGLWSRSGLVPVSYSQDTPGPMCRTVRDAALLLGALRGVDAADAATAASVAALDADFLGALQPSGLEGVRLAMLRQDLPDVSPVQRIEEQTIEALKTAGAIVIDPVDIPTIPELDVPELKVLLYEFKVALAKYLAERGPRERLKTLADVIRFNEEHRDIEMKFFGQEWFELAEQTTGLGSDEYLTALATCRQLARDNGIDQALRVHKVDALVSITSGPAWSADLLDGDHNTLGSSSLAAVAGYPSITVPAGFVYGLPVGISFMGTAWSEDRLLRYAYAFEHATRVRKPPKFLPTVVLDG